MICSRLLKSWAMPPVRCPIASIFCACAATSSACTRRVTSMLENKNPPSPVGCAPISMVRCPIRPWNIASSPAGSWPARARADRPHGFPAGLGHKLGTRRLETGTVQGLDRRRERRKLVVDLARKLGQALLLRRIFPRQLPQSGDEPRDTRHRLAVGLEIFGLLADDVAALAGLRVLNAGEQQPRRADHRVGGDDEIAAAAQPVRGNENQERGRDPRNRGRSATPRWRTGLCRHNRLLVRSARYDAAPARSKPVPRPEPRTAGR